MRIVFPVLFVTVTGTPDAVVMLPAASRAMAVNVCDASLAVVVSQDVEYGAIVVSAPRFAPSSRNCTPATATLSDASAVTVTVPESFAPELGAVIPTLGAVVSTVMFVAAEVVVLPAASRAIAVKVCAPLLVAAGFHEIEYGAAVVSAPRLAPSRRNWTPTTPTSSDAIAPMVVVPDTVALFAGAVMLTVGGAVSLETVTVTEVAVVVLAAASRATAVSVCDALLAVVVSH